MGWVKQKDKTRKWLEHDHTLINDQPHENETLNAQNHMHPLKWKKKKQHLPPRVKL